MIEESDWFKKGSKYITDAENLASSTKIKEESIIELEQKKEFDRGCNSVDTHLIFLDGQEYNEYKHINNMKPAVWNGKKNKYVKLDKTITRKKEEKYIRKVLRKFSKQYVTHSYTLNKKKMWCLGEGILCDTNIIKNAVDTCYLRGWLEEIPNPSEFGFITNGKLGASPYRLTEAGWGIIKNTHKWVIRTFIATIVIPILLFILIKII